MDLYKYRRRLKHLSAMEGMADNTKVIINNTFHESPNFKEVFLNGIKLDARVSVEEDQNQKSILFRPDTEVFKGDVVEYDGTHWLVNNTYDNDIYPTVFVDFCNEWLRWIDSTNKTLVYPCVVKGKTFDLNESRYVVYSENIVEITTPYNENTKKIVPKQRFLLNGKAYEIEGVDAISEVAFGKGIVQMKASETFAETLDNVVEQIADNKPNGWGGW